MSGRSILTMGLRDALEKEKCPICRLMRSRTEKYLWHLLYENISEPLFFERYKDTGGFCPEHNRLLQKLVQSRTLAGCTSAAALLQALIPGQLQLIAAYRREYSPSPAVIAGKPGLFRGGSQWLREFSRGLFPGLSTGRGAEENAQPGYLQQSGKPGFSAPSCLCCQIADSAERSYLITLAEVLSQKELHSAQDIFSQKELHSEQNIFSQKELHSAQDASSQKELYSAQEVPSPVEYRRLYQQSDGLCFPHFKKTIDYLKTGKEDGYLQETGEFLAADQEERLKKLQLSLERLRDNQRYNFEGILSPEEGRSWQEAIWRCTGWQPERIISRF